MKPKYNNQLSVQLSLLLAFFFIFLYPLLVRVELAGFKIQYILNLIVFIFFILQFLFIKSKVNKSTLFIIPFFLWSLITIFFGVLSDFQINNSNLDVQPFFKITENEFAENYFNIGEILLNIKYLTRVALAIFIGVFLGSVIKNIFPKHIICFLWLFLLVSLLFLSVQFLFNGDGRHSGIYSNPQDMSAIIIFNYILFSTFNRKKNNSLHVMLYLFITILCLLFTGTRSSLLVLILVLLFFKSPYFFVIFSLVTSVLVTFFLPLFVKNFFLISFTSVSSSIARMKLWGEYLLPNIYDNLLFGIGTVPVVTENLFLFLFFTYGSLGFFCFMIYLRAAYRYSSIYKNMILLMYGALFFQSIYFMGLFSVDNIMVTFFWISYLSSRKGIKACYV